MRPGRLDRKIEIPLPNEVARMEILKIHCGPVQKHGEIGELSPTFTSRQAREAWLIQDEVVPTDYEAIVKLTEGPYRCSIVR